MSPEADSSTLSTLRLLRRECVRAYTDALTEYQAIEGSLGEVRNHHRHRTQLTAAQGELIATLPDRGMRHGITLTRMSGALDQVQDDADAPGLDREIGEELVLMRRPVRPLADLYVLMIPVTSAEDVFGRPYVDPQLLPEHV